VSRPQDQDEVARAALESTVTLSLRVLRIAMAVLAVLFLGSGLFTVEPHEVAFVRRLGRIQGSPEMAALEPGAHWAWPALDEVVRVPARRIDRLATDAFALKLTSDEVVTGKPPQREGGLDPERDGYLLTGDANILHATFAARYDIAAPYAFTSRAEDAVALARPLLERAITRAAASRPVDDLLTAKKEAFLQEVQTTAQRSLDKLETGIRLLGVELAQDLVPPPQVRDAFAAVARAVQQRETVRSEARAAAAAAHGRTLAESAQAREQASSEAKRLGGDVAADVAVFRALLPEWRRDRRGVADRLLRDVLAQAKLEETFLVRPGEGVRVRLERDRREIIQGVLERANAKGAQEEKK
jgi:membrane protease subunit HflK